MLMNESVRQIRTCVCQTLSVNERGFTMHRLIPARGRGSLSISVYQIVSSRVFICPATLEAPWDAHVNCH